VKIYKLKKFITIKRYIIIMKKILKSILFMALILPAGLYASPNHGPIIKAFYAPYGGGTYIVPHDPAINGGDNGLTSDSANNGDHLLKTLKGYSISCGYYYDWIQGDINYTGIKTEDQYVVKASTPEDEFDADASLRNIDARLGYRFSNPGDTSYKWLYLGLRQTELEIPYNDTKVDATGFLGGFYGFSSFGLSGPVEFVLTYDIYAGTYRYNQNHLNTDVDIKIYRKISVDLGMSAGMGVQYEPWDLAVVLKVSPFITWNRYKSDDTGDNRVTDASLMGTQIGIEIIFSIPDYRNNITE